MTHTHKALIHVVCECIHATHILCIYDSSGLAFPSDETCSRVVTAQNTSRHMSARARASSRTNSTFRCLSQCKACLEDAMAGKEVSDYEFRTKDSSGAPIELLMSLPIQRTCCSYPPICTQTRMHACMRGAATSSRMHACM